MKSKAEGRDAGLSLRMLFTGALLSALDVGFAAVLFSMLKVDRPHVAICGKSDACAIPGQQPGRRPWRPGAQTNEADGGSERVRSGGRDRSG